MQLKKKIIVALASVACVSLVGASIYYKDRQAAQLSSKFKNAIQHGNYNEARVAYNKANKDKIINLIFNQNQNFKSSVSDEFSEIKNNYLKGNISFKEFQGKLNNIVIFNYLPKENVNKDVEEIKGIENVRQAYKKAEDLYSQKKYDEALQNLDLMADVDTVTTQKSGTLRDSIMLDYQGEVNSQVDSLVKEEKFSDALKFLDEKKNIYKENDLNGKVKYINDLIVKKAEADKKKKQEEERKREAEEEIRRQEEQKRQEEYLASFLKGYVPNPEKENAVKDVVSSTSFLIYVNLKAQATNIFIGQRGGWKLIRIYQCASGKPGDETPRGTFTITGRGTWFYNASYSEGAQYWTQFYGNYLFHSYPMDINGNVLDGSLGKPASHGCVRLDTTNAKWIYDNMPNGTKVIIN